MALSLATILILALGVSSGYAQYGMSVYQTSAPSYGAAPSSYNNYVTQAPPYGAAPASYSSYQAPAQSYSALSSYKSPSYGAVPSSYNSYVTPAPSYSATTASYGGYQIPVQTYSALSSYKSPSYGAAPSSYNSYATPAPLYSATQASYGGYQVPVQTYSASSSYKSSSYAAAPVVASPYGAASSGSYQASAPSYGVSSPSYGAASGGYQTAAPSYGAPISSYGTASLRSYQASAPSYGASNKSSSYSSSSSYSASPSYGSGSYPSATRSVRVSVMTNEFSENTPGTSQSFLSELLGAIQSVSNLRFTVTIRHDLGYPKQQANGNWDGSILAPLLNNEADLVGTDLTPNTEGEKVVDFTQLFLPYKLQVLVNKNSGYGYGGQSGQLQYVIADTEDWTYLKNSPQQNLQAIANNIQQGQTNGLGTVVSSNAEGVAKVLSGNNYAYIIESPFVQRALAQSSSLQVLPGDLGGYFNLAFATQLGSTLRKEFNIALLQVLQDGTLKSLLQKYNFYATAL